MLKRAVSASVIAVIALGAVPATAQALNTVRTWNDSSNPLKVTGYAYDTWKVYNSSNGTRSLASTYSKLSNADDHKVYVELGTQVNAGHCVQASKCMSCTQRYWDHASDETDHHSSKSYLYKSASTGVSDSADYARYTAAPKITGNLGRFSRPATPTRGIKIQQKRPLP
ncbi:hypothetical protein [Streptomyces sp. NPDC004435]|uniref:hypothetical protein n=1 Tax=Streptomyces sp. NPDC004435 TaxID=3364701 RepID=UPI0036792A5B